MLWLEDSTVVTHGCQMTKKANMSHERGKCCGLWPPAFPPSLCEPFLYDTDNLRSCSTDPDPWSTNQNNFIGFST